jgi:methionyl aminopeptidase
VTVDTGDDVAGLSRAGAAAAETLSFVSELVRPGVTTLELDAAAREVFLKHGARSAPNELYGFPGTLCISVNDEAVHGIPSKRPIMRGDVVKLDATPMLDGFVVDAAVTVVVGEASDRNSIALKVCAERALAKAIKTAAAGRTTRDVGRAVTREVASRGFRVLREVGGHGVGRRIHEEPHIPNWDDPSARSVLHEGLVVAIEPIISVGAERLVADRDGWTLRTSDGSLAAHVEHTVVVTSGAPLVLTAA